MMAIVNRGKPKNAKREDEQMYEVGINSKSLFAFLHNRDEPLSVFLAKASNAASQYEMLNKIVGEKVWD